MTKFKLLIICFTSIALLSSCEKVIDVDIKDAAPVIVIEGVVTNRADSQVVRVSRSALFGQANVFPAVRGAVVSITEDGVRKADLLESRPGVYVLRRVRGTPGHTYTLKVEADGKIYTASSTMPNQVRIDTVALNSSSFFGNIRRTISVEYQDPSGVKNYYRCLLQVNGTPSKQGFLFDDNFTDGKRVSQELFDFDLDIEEGDLAEIELHCIDSVIYRYWQGLDQNQNRGGASTTPANPVSNISNGALGYFSAHTKQNKVVRIP
ncbi:MAG TPA: DUF4249 domain-containing protein [Pedobacter sp.]|jgi:hypothetical protein